MTGFERIRATIAGGHPLRGAYGAPGAKNAVLPMMAASLLTDETCVIQNVPIISDVLIMAELLRRLGADVVLDEQAHTVAITAANVVPLTLIRRWLAGCAHRFR